VQAHRGWVRDGSPHRTIRPWRYSGGRVGSMRSVSITAARAQSVAGAGIVQKEPRERLAPSFEHADERTRGQMRRGAILSEVGQPDTVDCGANHECHVVDDERAVDRDRQRSFALVEFPPIDLSRRDAMTRVALACDRASALTRRTPAALHRSSKVRRFWFPPEPALPRRPLSRRTACGSYPRSRDASQRRARGERRAGATRVRRAAVHERDRRHGRRSEHR